MRRMAKTANLRDYMQVMSIMLSNTMCAVESAAISMRSSTSNASIRPSSSPHRSQSVFGEEQLHHWLACDYWDLCSTFRQRHCNARPPLCHEALLGMPSPSVVDLTTSLPSFAAITVASVRGRWSSATVLPDCESTMASIQSISVSVSEWRRGT